MIRRDECLDFRTKVRRLELLLEVDEKIEQLSSDGFEFPLFGPSWHVGDIA
jgi:hypothetical protein